MLFGQRKVELSEQLHVLLRLFFFLNLSLQARLAPISAEITAPVGVPVVFSLKMMVSTAKVSKLSSAHVFFH